MDGAHPTCMPNDRRLAADAPPVLPLPLLLAAWEAQAEPVCVACVWEGRVRACVTVCVVLQPLLQVALGA